MVRLANLLFAGVVCVAISMMTVTLTTSVQRAHSHRERTQSHSDHEGAPTGDLANSTSFPVVIRKPAGPPQIKLAGSDPQGRSASVACSTCHSVRPPNRDNKTPQSLDEFHQGLQFNHGQLSCYSCHNPENADVLRLADGTVVEYADVMLLCTQCHSKQAESFAHGAHGGMNGFWDLSRGPQTKNNCIDCHDPHAPNYPKMIVDFKPRDRFLDPPKAEHDKHE
ncbi:MAG: cytochrome c3 family protein [Aureliella sp.]